MDEKDSEQVAVSFNYSFQWSPRNFEENQQNVIEEEQGLVY